MTKSFKEPDFDALKKTKQQFYLFGEHISKSKAPFLHNTLFKLLGLDWNYTQFESSDLTTFHHKFDNERLIGSAVTMPNKVNAIKIVDELDEVGKGCGSINTIYTRQTTDLGKPLRVGTNTDTVGISESFIQNYPEETKRYEGMPGLVYGGGGACRSAIYALYKLLNVSKVYIINRFESEVLDVIKTMKENGFEGEIIHVKNPEQAKLIQDIPKLMVLTVPNFEPKTQEEIRARDTLNVFKSVTQGIVLEMCYHPVIETTLFHEFKESGWKIISGVEAMIYQGIAQQVLWTGLRLEQLPVKKVVDILYEQVRAESEA